MLNLFNTNRILDYEDPPIKKNSFEVYESTTFDFYNSSRTPWPFDDSAYICTMDMVDEIYDEEYLTYPDIWKAELSLISKYESREINRFVTNKRVFQNYNLYGRHTYASVLSRKMLKARGLL
jgi:hypothetical protein